MRKKIILPIICVGVPLLFVAYFVLYCFVGFPVSVARFKKEAGDFCAKIKEIKEFDDLNGRSLSTNINTKIKEIKHIYLDDLPETIETKTVSNYTVSLYYTKQKISKIEFKDHNNSHVELCFTHPYTITYLIRDDGTFTRFEDGVDVVEMPQNEWESSVMEHFYLFSAYEPSGHLVYLNEALNNITKVSKKPSHYFIHSATNNLSIDWSILHAEHTVRFKFSVTEYEYDDLGRITLERITEYDFHA